MTPSTHFLYNPYGYSSSSTTTPPPPGLRYHTSITQLANGILNEVTPSSCQTPMPFYPRVFSQQFATNLINTIPLQNPITGVITYFQVPVIQFARPIFSEPNDQYSQSSTPFPQQQAAISSTNPRTDAITYFPQQQATTSIDVNSLKLGETPTRKRLKRPLDGAEYTLENKRQKTNQSDSESALVRSFEIPPYEQLNFKLEKFTSYNVYLVKDAFEIHSLTDYEFDILKKYLLAGMQNTNYARYLLDTLIHLFLIKKFKDQSDLLKTRKHNFFLTSLNMAELLKIRNGILRIKRLEGFLQTGSAYISKSSPRFDKTSERDYSKIAKMLQARGFKDYRKNNRSLKPYILTAIATGFGYSVQEAINYNANSTIKNTEYRSFIKSLIKNDSSKNFETLVKVIDAHVKRKYGAGYLENWHPHLL